MNWLLRLFTGNRLFTQFSSEDKREFLDWNMLFLRSELERRKGRVSVIDMTGESKLLHRLSDAEVNQLIEIRRLGDRADATSGDTAINLYKQVARLAPWDEICLMTIGVEYAQMGKFDQAIPWLKKALSVNPGSARVRSNLESISAAAKQR